MKREWLRLSSDKYYTISHWFHHSPHHLQRVFSISSSSGYGSSNENRVLCHSPLVRFPRHADVYSQYGGYHPEDSQSIIPTILHPRIKMLNGFKSQCVKTGVGHRPSCRAIMSLRSSASCSVTWSPICATSRPSLSQW